MVDAMKNPDDVEDCNYIQCFRFFCRNEEIKVVTFEEFEDEDLKTIDIAC